MRIRPATNDDFSAIWRIFRAVVGEGTTYPYAPDTTEDEARAIWMSPSNAGVFVAVSDSGDIVGTYTFRANQKGLGDHVANASFMVAPWSAGLGVGRLMGEHCLEQARAAGFRAMQFNFVVSTNERAVALWRRLGFAVVGTVPGAFRHRDLGDVDVFVMHRWL